MLIYIVKSILGIFFFFFSLPSCFRVQTQDRHAVLLPKQQWWTLGARLKQLKYRYCVWVRDGVEQEGAHTSGLIELVTRKKEKNIIITRTFSLHQFMASCVRRETRFDQSGVYLCACVCVCDLSVWSREGRSKLERYWAKGERSTPGVEVKSETNTVYMFPALRGDARALTWMNLIVC